MKSKIKLLSLETGERKKENKTTCIYTVLWMLIKNFFSKLISYLFDTYFLLDIIMCAEEIKNFQADEWTHCHTVVCRMEFVRRSGIKQKVSQRKIFNENMKQFEYACKMKFSRFIRWTWSCELTNWITWTCITSLIWFWILNKANVSDFLRDFCYGFCRLIFWEFNTLRSPYVNTQALPATTMRGKKLNSSMWNNH